MKVFPCIDIIALAKSEVLTLLDLSQTLDTFLACQGRTQNLLRLALNGTNLGYFKISEPKCMEADLKKSQIFPIWGQPGHPCQFGSPSV